MIHNPHTLATQVRYNNSETKLMKLALLCLIDSSHLQCEVMKYTKYNSAASDILLNE